LGLLMMNNGEPITGRDRLRRAGGSLDMGAFRRIRGPAP
jgi:hypothetical protein